MKSEATMLNGAQTPEQAARVAAFRARMQSVEERPERAPETVLTRDDLRRLAELPQTPPNEKDAFLRSFRERLLAR
jgi:ribonuclease D